MAFLVKDLVDRQIFGGVRLVAGVLNVSNPILWVNVMEILDTPRSLNEGELVVSTGYGLEDQSLHKDLIHQLKKRGVSGLAIQPGYYIDQIPEYIIEDANKEGLPVLELPERRHFQRSFMCLWIRSRKQSYFQKAGPGTGHTAHCTWKKIKYQ